MSVNFIPNTNPSPQPYHLAQGKEQVVNVPEIGQAQLCSPATNAICAELGVVDVQNGLQIHPIDKVEKTTSAKKVHALSNALSIYRENSEIFSVDFFKSYYGLNINRRNKG